MIAAWRLPGARFVTIEAQAGSVALARKSAAYNGLNDRYDIRHGDFRDPGLLDAGECFDLVLASPPYFPPGAGADSTHQQKAACRFELRGDVADYARVAGRHLRCGGLFVCVYPESRRDYLEQSAQAAGLTQVRRRPVIFREGEPPLVTLSAFMRRSDLPAGMHDRPWVEPPLVIRTAGKAVHPEYAAIKLAFGFPP
jgi:tRNA1(Val) A37 N6-methylase TrmN6